MSGRERWLRIAAWFLAISYGIGAPLTAVIEYRSQTFSQRFDLPPATSLAAIFYTAVQVWFGLQSRERRVPLRKPL